MSDDEPVTMSVKTAGGHLRRMFISGLFALIPIGATIWIVTGLFQWLDALLQPLIVIVVGYAIPGVGFFATVLLVYLLGLVANNVFGKKVLQAWESLIGRIPLIKGLYGGVKQVAEAFGPQSKDQFRDVVLIEFPHPQSFALGFATLAIDVPDIGACRYVFVPTTPNPTSGYMLVVPTARLRFIDMSVEDGLKLVISGGVVGPSLALRS